MKLISGVRVILELATLTAILLLVTRWFFPGAWRGIGVSEALRAASTAGSRAGSSTDPIAAPADLMALLLTVVTIVMTAVAFFVAVGAFFGYGAIKDLADATARKKIEPLQASLEKAVAEAAAAVNVAVAGLEDRFNELRKNLEAERAEGQGLPEGKESDEIALASGNPPPTTP